MIDHTEALNENMKYCNDLEDRINKLSDALIALNRRIIDLEKLKNDR